MISLTLRIERRDGGEMDVDKFRACLRQSDDLLDCRRDVPTILQAEVLELRLRTFGLLQVFALNETTMHVRLVVQRALR